MSRKSRKVEKQSSIKKLFKEEWKLVCGVLLLTFLAYANTLQNDWAYDDWFQVSKNKQITSYSNIPKTFTQSVWQFMDETKRETNGLYYRPIFNSALIIEYQLFGQKVWAWHLVSVLLHLIVVLLVYALARAWSLDKSVAAIAALIFGLHPVHAEAVAWISSLPDLLVSIFALASLLAYEKARGAHIQLHRSWMCASLLFALLAMFSKEQAVMLPFVIAAREFFDNQDALKTKLKQATFCAALFLALAFIYLIARYFVLGLVSGRYENEITLKQMLLTIPSVMFDYARMLFTPYPLAIIYKDTYVQSITDPKFLIPVFIVILIFVVAIRLIKSSAIALRAFSLFLFFLLPVLNLRVFNPNESLVHDRYLYLPSIGFCLLAGLGLMKLSERFNEKAREVLIAATAVIAVIFFSLTFFQNRTWQDDYALFNHALKYTTNKPYLYNALANSYVENNRFDEAEKVYLQSVAVAPDFGATNSGLGYVYSKLGKHDEALKYFQRAIETNKPAVAADYFNLGSTYINLKKNDEAEKALLKAIELEPLYVPAHYNLGWIYDGRGQKELAAKYYRKAAELEPKR